MCYSNKLCDRNAFSAVKDAEAEDMFRSAFLCGMCFYLIFARKRKIRVIMIWRSNN